VCELAADPPKQARACAAEVRATYLGPADCTQGSHLRVPPTG
jgi:hypothetical protein